MTEDEKIVHIFCTDSYFKQCWEAVFSEVYTVLVHPHTHFHTKMNTDFDHLKKNTELYFSQCGEDTVVVTRTAVSAVLLKVWNSTKDQMGKSQVCQILPGRRSAIIQVWQGPAYLTHPADGAGLYGVPRLSTGPFHVIEFIASLPWVSFDLKYSWFALDHLRRGSFP